MPPVAQQGSRAGLITALVIVTLLFVGFAVWGFMKQSENQKLRDELASERQTREQVANEADMSGPVAALTRSAGEGANRATAIQISMEQTRRLAELIAGQRATQAAAAERARTAIALGTEAAERAAGVNTEAQETIQNRGGAGGAGGTGAGGTDAGPGARGNTAVTERVTLAAAGAPPIDFGDAAGDGPAGGTTGGARGGGPAGGPAGGGATGGGATGGAAGGGADSGGATNGVPNVPLNQGDSLVTVIDVLVVRLAELEDRIDELRGEVSTARTQATTTAADMEQIRTDYQTAIEANNQRAQAAVEANATLQADYEKQVEAAKTAAQAAIEEAEENRREALARLQGKNKRIAALQEEIETLTRRLKTMTVAVDNPQVRQPDGEITRLVGDDTVYINLGQGDQISPGLTFEVYAADEGVPPPDPRTVGRANELPEGKASIEVVAAGPGSSECRVVRRQPGTRLEVGDIVANLVYDTRTTYNFVVYGEFDLDQDGRTSTNDAEVIRRLIAQWGGEVTDVPNTDRTRPDAAAEAVDANVDFVVLGEEPEVPIYDDPTPTQEVATQVATRARDRYLAVRDRAIDMSIPILNQNRFLFFVGYYDQAAGLATSR